MLQETAIQAFQAGLRGRLIQTGDAEYEAARRVYNGMIDRHPRFVAPCAGVADVMACVNFARAQQLRLAVRGGGHNVAGFGTCDDGLVIDLSPMKGIRVDPERRTVLVQGGCVWREVDHETHAFGLATPGGIVGSTGVAGLSLGGGIGHLARKYGLSCDNLLAADVVTAEGRLLRASAQENADLFWALRGGGGNFGVVTAFEFQLHPVDMIFGGAVFYPIEMAGDVMRMYREFIATAPEDVAAFFGFHIAPPAPFIPANLQGKHVAAIIGGYLGPIERAEDALRTIREFGPPVLYLMAPIPFPALQGLLDPLLPPGLQHYWKSDFINELTDEAIDLHVQYGAQVPAYQSAVHFYPINGAVHRVGKQETAFYYRDAQLAHVIAAMYPDPADTPQNKQWVRDYWSAVHP
ncbi:MAG TPA: FAD-binding oxidoreductase, partial [Armatimonadota bacterium]|nr:FAD-binding oxidoreductase [Armatimonadota bacterium]